MAAAPQWTSTGASDVIGGLTGNTWGDLSWYIDNQIPVWVPTTTGQKATGRMPPITSSASARSSSPTRPSRTAARSTRSGSKEPRSPTRAPRNLAPPRPRLLLGPWRFLPARRDRGGPAWSASGRPAPALIASEAPGAWHLGGRPSRVGTRLPVRRHVLGPAYGSPAATHPTMRRPIHGWRAPCPDDPIVPIATIGR